MNTRSLRFVLYLAVVALVLAGCSGGHHSSNQLTVTITNPISTIAPGGAGVTINATVGNDGSTPGVSWTLVNTGTSTACSPACGALSNNTATSVTYTPPATVPSPATVSIVATSNSDSTVTAVNSFTIQASASTSACQASPQLRGNESALTMPIAFLVKGSDGDDEPIAYAGSFTPDSTGSLTNGAVDLVSYEEGTGQEGVDLGASSYSYGSDGRGCLYFSFDEDAKLKHPVASSKTRKSFTHERRGHAATRSSAPKRVSHSKRWLSKKANANASSKKRKFGAQAAGDGDSLVLSFVILDLGGPGRIMEFDNTDGEGTIASGQMHVQTPAAFTLGSLASNFAFGVDGWSPDPLGGIDRAAIAGSFENDGVGELSNGFADENIGGNASGELNGGAGNIEQTVDGTTGRGTGSYSSTNSEGAVEFDFVIYIVNGSDFYILSSDDPTDDAAMLSGRALKSAATSTALNGYYLTALTGLNCDDCGDSEGDNGNNYAAIGTMHATTALAATGTEYYNDGETTNTVPYTGTYVIDTTAGRVAFSNTNSNAVGYLTATANEDDIVAFLVGTDENASGGFIALQASSTPAYDNSALNGAYAFGSAEDIVGQEGSIDGVFTFDDGGYTVIGDANFFDEAQSPDQTGNGNYQVNADGSGTFSATGSEDAAAELVTNGTLALGIDLDSDQPLLYVFIQGPQTPDRAVAKKKTAHK